MNRHIAGLFIAALLIAAPPAPAQVLAPPINYGGGAGGGGGGGSGTVTSVALSFPNNVTCTVSGSPITTSGTLVCTPSGTSGGIPYFSASNQIASSAALTANAPVIGGGAGGAPSVGSRSGNTTVFATTTGTLTSGHAAAFDASGNVVDSGAAPGTGTVSIVATGAGLTGGTITTTGTLSLTELIRAVTGTTDTILSTDAAKLVTYSNASAIAVTLPQATGSFAAGFGLSVQNLGAGLVTITPTTSTINGAATLTVPQGMGCDLISDGTNWQISACTAAVPLTSSSVFGLSKVDGTTITASGGVITAIAGSGTVNSGTATHGGYYATSAAAISDGGAADVGFGAVEVLGGVAASNGIELASAGNIALMAAGGNRLQIAAALATWRVPQTSGTTGGPTITTAASSATAPSLVPNNSCGNCGLGGAANVPAIIVGGATIANWSSTGPVFTVIPSDATHTDTSVCRDTTSGAALTGTGTLGICLGTSTREAKTAITPLSDNALAQIERLKPVAFNYRPGWGYPSDKRYFGFLAEDMQPVLPELVAHDANGRVRSADYLGVIPVLVKAVQQQQTEIKELWASIGALLVFTFAGFIWLARKR